MIDTKQTYENLLGLDFTAKQAEGLTKILSQQDTEKLEVRLTKVEAKLDVLDGKLTLLLWMVPICMGILGLLITFKKIG